MKLLIIIYIYFNLVSCNGNKVPNDFYCDNECNVLSISMKEISIPNSSYNIKYDLHRFQGAREYIRFDAPSAAANMFVEQVIESKPSSDLSELDLHFSRKTSSSEEFGKLEWWIGNFDSSMKGGKYTVPGEGEINIVIQDRGVCSTVWLVVETV